MNLQDPSQPESAPLSSTGIVPSPASGPVSSADVPTSAIFTVHGQVRQLDGATFPGATVVAVDQDLRGEEVLGQTISDQNGHYQIQYTAAQFARADKARMASRMVSPGCKAFLAKARMIACQL